MPIEEKLQLIVCGTVELLNCSIVESFNLHAPALPVNKTTVYIHYFH